MAREKKETIGPIKTGNEKLLLGLVAGLLTGSIFAVPFLALVANGYKYAIAVMIIAFLILTILFLITVAFRDRIVKAIFGEVHDLDSFPADAKTLIGSTAEVISDHVTKPFPEPHRKRIRQIAPGLANYLIWGRVRSWWFNLLVGLFLAIGGLTTTVLLVNQNQLLETQNKKIDIQNALAEGQRRSSLVLLMENVLTDLSKEIDKQKEGLSKDSILVLDSLGYSLGAPLIGRISSLSQGLLPYQMLIQGELTEKEYSPERAQLLLALVGYGLDNSALESIYSKTPFSNVYLNKSILSGTDLRGIYLRGSDLSEAYLIETDLWFANLSETDLSKAFLLRTNLLEANLIGADLSKAYLEKAVLTQAILTGANLSGANLSEANLEDAQGLSKNQLSSCKSLYKTTGIDEWQEELEKEKPCLFTSQGCPVH